jgi:hypothetical protein
MGVNETFDEIYELSHLIEMSNLLKRDTGLPVNIWLDSSQLYIRGGHSKRIKFQSNRGNKLDNYELITMTIEDNPKVIGTKNLHLSWKDVKLIKQFVINNKEALERLADMDISFLEFTKMMIL